MLHLKLPVALIGRLLLVLLLACNLTLCIAAHSQMAATAPETSCHATTETASGEQESCIFAQGVVNQLDGQSQLWLLALLALPLLLLTLLLPRAFLLAGRLAPPHWFDSGPPHSSWPRRHLQLCVLRN